MRFAIRKTTSLVTAAALGVVSMSAFAANRSVTVGAGGGLTFSPPTLSISAGDTVTFTYAGGAAPHNVRSDPTAVTQFRCANGCDGVGSGNGNPTSAGWTATIAFPTLGSVPYYCEIHGGPGGQGMAGSITVTTPVEIQSFEVD